MHRNLYQCSHARVMHDDIYCDAGHKLRGNKSTGYMNVRELAKGNPLEPKVCQQCPDYKVLGAPVPVSERGWLITRKGGR